MWTFAVVAVIVLHAAYLVFQMLGALLILRNRHWAWAHLAAVTWGITIVAMQWGCPLTRLEKDFIAYSGATPYDGSYLDRYLFGVLLPDGTQTLVYALHLVVIIATYVYVLHRLRQPRPAESETRLPDEEPAQRVGGAGRRS